MVTTRSRNKAVAQDANPPATKQLKRKGSTIDTTTPPTTTKIPKTELADDLKAEEELPRAPAPTPVAPHPNALSKPTVPTTASTTTAPTSVPAPIPASVPAPAPTSTQPSLANNSLTSAVTETVVLPPPPATQPEATSTLETLKEPTPVASTLPDVSTVLNQPVTAALESLTTTTAASTIPPLPTIPAATAPAPAPVAAPVAAPSSVTTSATSGLPTEFHEQTPLDAAAVGNGVSGSGDIVTANGATAPTVTVPVTITETKATLPILPLKTDNNLTDNNVSSTLAGIDAITAANTNTNARGYESSAQI
ncbi:hypothetical protein BGZ46_002320 [Entomortierella lignicola]|nr:hypothetical protein BGZ46_002320 [Entomortierella lignicola]